MIIIGGSGLLLLCGVALVMLKSGQWDWLKLWPVIMLCGGGMLIQFFTKRHKPLADGLLLPIATIFAAVGLLMIFRLRPELYYTQSIWLLLGMIVYLALALSKNLMAGLSNYKYVIGITGIVFLMTAVIFGVDIGGHRDWVVLGPIRFQPAELAKILLVAFFAAYLSDNRQLLQSFSYKWRGLSFPHPRLIGPLAFIWVMTMIMLMFQRDLGSALMYFGTAFAMIYIASGRKIYLWAGGLAFLLTSWLCYHLYSHIKVRVDIWLNPWADPDGKSFQLVQSIFAFGTGGLLGVGLDWGNPLVIPEVHTDFILAAIGEELGLLAIVSLLLLYSALFYRGLKISLRAKDSFRALFAVGTVICLALQTILIVGGVTGFLPLTGITLPLVSYGGSSMITIFGFLALLFNVSGVEEDGV